MNSRDPDFFLRALATDDLLVDEATREAFKSKRAGGRPDLEASPFVPLDPNVRAPDVVRLSDRRSDRWFRSDPVALSDLSALLAALDPVEVTGQTLRRYPSAGSTYAVGAYLQIARGGVEGVPPGLYFYDADARRLVLTSNATPLAADHHFPANRVWIARGAFTLFLVADLSAIRPLYGRKARDFTLLEAGQMAQLLEGAAPSVGLGLCQAGVFDASPLAEGLGLGPDHEILAALVGGAAARRVEVQVAPVAEASQSAPSAAQTPRPTTPAVLSERSDHAPQPLAASEARIKNGFVERVEASPPARPVETSRPRSGRRARLEAELSALWRELLGAEVLDPTALFFDVGATSIMAARAIRRLQDRYPALELDVADIFASPSVRDLAACLDRKLGDDPEAGEEDRAPTPLAFTLRPAPSPCAAFSGGDEPRLESPTLEVIEAPRTTPTRAEDVAIVGIALRVSGADTPDAFWALLEAGACRVGPQPESRRALVPDFVPRADQTYRGSYLEAIEAFDPQFFHMSPREAERVEPAQRLMLEVTAELLASVGYLGGQLAGTRTGVFIGASRGDYADLLGPEASDLTRLLPGNMAAIIANRISHYLDVQGPSVVLDTACSSSLVAVDRAVLAIGSGDIDAAIVGGVNLILSPRTFEAFRQDGMESPSGQCRTFDAGADGFVRGEGVVAMLLKRRSLAERDGDPIVAVIKGSASNHDGRTSSLPVPSPVAQRRVIELALERAGLTARDLGYVEAHGTGTKLGDPIELRGLMDAYRAHDPAPASIAIGSLKSNLGHLEFAAGIAGLAKAALAVERGQIPPSLHFEAPNPHIDFPSSPFFVADRARSWPGPSPRRAAVSAFGVGGANAHVILEAATPAPRPAATWERPAHWIVLSAPGEVELEQQLRALLDHVERRPDLDLGDLAFTLATGRPHAATRAALVVRDRAQLLDQLSLVILGMNASEAEARRRVRERVAFGVTSETPILEDAVAQRLFGLFDGLTDSGRRALRRWATDPRLDALFGPAVDGEVPPPASLCRAGWVDLFTLLSELWVRGFGVDLRAIDQGFARRRLPVPGLALRRERCWWPSTSRSALAAPRRPLEAPRPERAREPAALQPASSAAVQIAPSRPASHDEVVAFLRARVGAALGLPIERVGRAQPLVEMGVDSLAAVELVAALREQTGQELGPTFFFQHPTIDEMAQALLALAPTAAFASAPAAASSTAADRWASTPVDAPAAPAPRPMRSASRRAPSGAIAIVGLAGRFPGARNLAELWRNLDEGRDAITEIPRERFDVDALFDPNPKADRGISGRWGGFIEGLGAFDARFFRISEREARLMDPQQRLLLTTTWEALEDAGLARRIVGTRSGVYVGASYTHHRDQLAAAGHRLVDGHAALDNHNAILANRVSYFLDLRGPCFTVDTLCSSSLVALHTATRALRAGEAEMAIVAGVQAGLSPGYYEAVSRLGALSPDGRCRTFDARANGYVPGEGVVALVLRPLEDALRDGDPVRAVLLGTAVNHGGQASGLTVPNPRAQAEVVRAALEDAGIEGSSLSYVETHGTGTSLGDPVEIAGLELALKEGTTRRQFCGVGSIKSNIGHLEPAAGLASLAKVVLALEHRRIPKTLHVETPNRAIPFEDGPCYIVDRARAWTSTGPRRAGVSAFGLGGTNAHAILEEAPEPEARALETHGPWLYVLSAKTPTALRAMAERHLAFVRAEGRRFAVVDLCRAAAERAFFAHRAAVVTSSLGELEARLEGVVRALREGRPIDGPAGDSRADHLGRAFLEGRTIDPSELHHGARTAPLPTYPFEERDLARDAVPRARPAHPLSEHLEPAPAPSGVTRFAVRLDLGGLR